MSKRTILVIAALLVGVVPPAVAQVTIGDDVSMKLNATLSAGYTANYGNAISSDHGFTFGGNGDLSGSYYDPNFLSFHLQPFYNQSRANSTFQSISDSSGVNATAALFSGSHYPGSISYSKTYNSEGNFAVPGLANYTTHGDGGVFDIGWGVNIPDKPTLNVNFQHGSNKYSIYGTNDESNSRFNSFSTTSGYTLEGFHLTGNYHYTGTESMIPNLVADQPAEQSNSASNSFGFGASHRLPFNGSFSGGVNHSNTSSDFTSGKYNATINAYSTGVSFNPVEKLTFGTNAQYNDNLGGTLFNAIVNAGGVVPESSIRESSHALDVNTYANYRLPLHLTAMGTFDHREQSIFGTSLTDNAYTGTLSYTNSLLGGYISAVGGVTQNVLNIRNQSTLGLISSLNYSRRIGRWNANAGFNYEQNQQTLLIAYTTSSYGYTAGLGRRLWGNSHWGMSASGSKSGLTNQANSGTFSQSYSTSLSIRWLGVNGAYAKSSGNAIATGGGLVPIPIPLPVVTPTSVILYGGHSYSFGVGASPIRGLTISGSYARAFSDTISTALTSNNRTEMLTTRAQYQFRQMFFQAGYTKLVQGFSAGGLPPAMVGSYYVGISRWFNFF